MRLAIVPVAAAVAAELQSTVPLGPIETFLKKPGLPFERSRRCKVRSRWDRLRLASAKEDDTSVCRLVAKYGPAGTDEMVRWHVAGTGF